MLARIFLLLQCFAIATLLLLPFYSCDESDPIEPSYIGSTSTSDNGYILYDVVINNDTIPLPASYHDYKDYLLSYVDSVAPNMTFNTYVDYKHSISTLDSPCLHTTSPSKTDVTFYTLLCASLRLQLSKYANPNY